MGILGNIAGFLFMALVILIVLLILCFICAGVLAAIVEAIYEETGKLEVLYNILRHIL